MVIERAARSKLGSPFIFKKAYSNEAYLLTIMDDDGIIPPINSPFLKDIIECINVSK